MLAGIEGFRQGEDRTCFIRDINLAISNCLFLLTTLYSAES